jgi:hypothetical protein
MNKLLLFVSSIILASLAIVGAVRAANQASIPLSSAYVFTAPSASKSKEYSGGMIIFMRQE